MVSIGVVERVGKSIASSFLRTEAYSHGWIGGVLIVCGDKELDASGGGGGDDEGITAS